MALKIASEMKPLSPFDPSLVGPGEIAVSLLIPARSAAQNLEHTVSEAHRFLSGSFPDQFEIILIPNPAQPVGGFSDRSLEVAQEIAKRFSSVRVTPHFTPRGKGAALRTGFLASRGRAIFFTDADLPYDLDFFTQAHAKLEQGYGLVTGNRRLAESHFQIPVELLRLAYKRHRLGLWFNRVVRLLFSSIETTDTQAGIKALRRDLAAHAFSRLSCPGFFFDIELFLITYRQGFAQTELPVRLFLNTEKSTVRVLRESGLAIYWLLRIGWQNLTGFYGVSRAPMQILSRYRDIPFSLRLFLIARWYLTPYESMARELPPEGDILDLGSGHGLLSLAVALQHPSRNVLGLDHDEKRNEVASGAARAVPNLKIASGTLLKPPARLFKGITLIDVMHYFDSDTQKQILAGAQAALPCGGVLLVREVNPQGGIVARWNRFYEKMATRSGFTHSEKKSDLYFRSPEEWASLLEDLGFLVRHRPCSSVLFSDVLFICEKK